MNINIIIGSILFAVVVYVVVDYFALKKNLYLGDAVGSSGWLIFEIVCYLLLFAGNYVNIVEPYISGNYKFHIAHIVLLMSIPIWGYMILYRISKIYNALKAYKERNK